MLCTGLAVSSRLRTISSLTRKLSLSNSRILVQSADSLGSPTNTCGEYIFTFFGDEHH